MIFTKRSTAEEVTQGIDLSGKTIVITGINSGLGYETMRVLAMRGAHVIGAARTLEKAEAACAKINGQTTPVACELSDLNSVQACANSILAMKQPIDVLICNAGIMALPQLQVKDGLEMQFLTNHMGHFLLTYLLQSAIIQAKGRIVMLSSIAHRFSVGKGINFNNLDGSKGYNGWRFYGQSKLANLLSAVAFNEQLKEQGVTANAVHPGVINTNLGRQLKGPMTIAMKLPFLGKNVPQGASTQCYVATHSDVDGMGGWYFADNAPAKTSAHGRDKKLAQQLWDYSINYLQTYLKNQPTNQSAAKETTNKTVDA